MKTCKLSLLIITWLITRQLSAQTVSAVFHHLTVEDGLTDGNIRCIAQDAYGFMWFGTSSGLNRYDGYSIKSYQKKIRDSNSPSDDVINDLLVAKDNKLWIGTAGGLNVYDLMKDTFIHSFHKENDPQSLPSNDVRRLAEDSQGNVWIATEGRLTRYAPAAKQYTHYPPLNEPPLTDIIDIVLDNKDQLWITSGSWGGAAGNGLYIIKHDSSTIQKISLPAVYKSKTVSQSLFGIAFDPAGYIWCSSFSGMLFKIHTDTYAAEMFDDLMKRGPEQNLCASICCDQHGRLWFATRFSGIATCKSRGNDFKFFSHYPFVNTYLSSETTNTIFADHSGMVWIGTAGKGVDRFHPDRQYFTSVYSGTDAGSSLPAPWVRCFTENAPHQLLIGTSEGLTQYNRVTNACITYINDVHNPSSISFNSIRALHTDRNGNTWIGTAAGLNLMRSGEKTFKRFIRNPHDPYSPLTSFFYSVIEDKDGDIWVSGNGGMELIDPVTNKFYNRRNDTLLSSLPSNSLLWCTFADSRGNTWIGYQGEGLVKMNYHQKILHLFSITGDSTGLPHGSVNDIGEDSSGHIWIGTNGGVSCLDPETNLFTTFTTDDGLPANKISGIMVDGRNRVWMSTSRGLAVYDQQLHSFRIFTVADGLPANQFNEQKAYRTHDGYFCYATMNGALIFHPDSILVNPLPPQISMTRFSVFGENRDLSQAIENTKHIILSWKENFFTIDFAALNFDQPDQNQYACQLLGFDRDPRFLGTRNSVSYTNVPPGDYTLHVTAANNDGIWNREGIRVQLRIAPPFWQTTWFRVSVVVFLSLLFYALYRYRISIIRRREGEKTEINRRIAELRLSALRTQMNPHFIFNSISSIQNLISSEKKEDSVDYIGKFSRLIRLILHQASNNSITLEEEVEMLRLYLEMESLRFDKSFSYAIDVPAVLKQRNPEIPTMIIQPVVENAVIHGLLNKDEPGFLRISFVLKGEYVECTVEDNGVGRRAAEEIKKGKLFQHNSIATRVTGERLEILNKVFTMSTSIGTFDLEDGNGKPTGTRVIIELPVIEN